MRTIVVHNYVGDRRASDATVEQQHILERARQSGIKAAQEGKPITASTFKWNSPIGAAWEEGWKSVKQGRDAASRYKVELKRGKWYVTGTSISENEVFVSEREAQQFKRDLEHEDDIRGRR